MTRIPRLLVVAAVSVAAFVAAVNSSGKAADETCVARGERDGSYAVRLEGPLTVSTTTQRLEVTRAGRPVTGARVCFSADMGGRGGMSGMAVDDRATEVAPGRYEVPARFLMSGYWQGSILVRQEGRPTVQVPLSFWVS